jgi:hypothetical protein
MEKRQFERIDATIKVTYCLVPKAELVKILSDSAYRESSADHLPELSKKSAILHAVTKDISMAGMSLVGQETLPEDSALEIHLYLPGYPVPIKMIAEVVRMQTESTSNSGNTFRAGIKILALNRQDVNRLDKYLLAEKIRMRNAEPKK